VCAAHHPVVIVGSQVALPDQHHREKDGTIVGDVVEWVEPGRARPGYAGTIVGDPDPEPDTDQQDQHVFGPPRSGYGSFPFLINVLSGLIYCLQNIILTQKVLAKNSNFYTEDDVPVGKL
jgi:hypothetical protein